MPGLPELPVSVDPDVRQEDGERALKNVYQTHRGKLPEGHDDTRPALPRPEGPLRYREVD